MFPSAASLTALSAGIYEVALAPWESTFADRQLAPQQQDEQPRGLVLGRQDRVIRNGEGDLKWKTCDSKKYPYDSGVSFAN
jgi:hypothetical protein